MSIQSYNLHKYSAKRRGIGFKLSYEEWSDIWGDKISNRGTSAENYCMSRTGDKGAYEVGNVYINTNRNNAREASIRATVNAWTSAETERAYNLYKDGKSLKEISRALGRTENAVVMRLYRRRKVSAAKLRGRV